MATSEAGPLYSARWLVPFTTWPGMSIRGRLFGKSPGDRCISASSVGCYALLGQPRTEARGRSGLKCQLAMERLNLLRGSLPCKRLHDAPPARCSHGRSQCRRPGERPNRVREFATIRSFHEQAGLSAATASGTPPFCRRSKAFLSRPPPGTQCRILRRRKRLDALASGKYRSGVEARQLIVGNTAKKTDMLLDGTCARARSSSRAVPRPSPAIRQRNPGNSPVEKGDGFNHEVMALAPLESPHRQKRPTIRRMRTAPGQRSHRCPA
jgi:hypothetical protein